MKKYLAPLAVAAAFVATPAMANDFAGVRAEVTAGLDDVTGGVDPTDVAYGAGVGLDAKLYKNVVVGVEATLDNVFDRRKLEGLRVGGGVEANLYGPVYGKIEYRYTDFDGGVGQHGGLVGLGVRF